MTTTTPAPATGGLLSSIQHGVERDAPRILLYGVDGVGKTTFAAGAPNPIFLRHSDERFGRLDVSRFPAAETFESLLAQLEALLVNEHDYKTVVIDSISAFEPALQRHAAERRGKKHVEDFGYGKGFNFAADDFAELLESVDLLRKHKGMGVILLCHSTVTRVNDPENEPYDTYELSVHKQVAARVRRWADAVLFANYLVRTIKVGDEGKQRTIGAGHGERVLYTTKRPAWHAKNRYSLPDQLPLSWDAFWGAFQAGPQTNETTEATTNEEN